MQQKRFLFLLTIGGLILLVGGSLMLLTPQTVSAYSAPVHPVLAHSPLANCVPGSVLYQCGSQASSCKTCHEVQASDPVNNDGTGWHESHAFGDFCIFCHAGNEQATDKDAAHTGMVAPLSDIDTACKACHSSDLMERAQVYAVALGVEIGSGSSTPTPVSPTDVPASNESSIVDAPASNQPTISAPTGESSAVSLSSDHEIVVDDPNLVDYVQRYNEIVLGEHPVNWGNIILVGLIALVVVGGMGFIILNEIRLRLASVETQMVEGQYPADVLEMLPAISRLKLQTRIALKHILNTPHKADKVLSLIDTVVSSEDTEEDTK